MTDSSVNNGQTVNNTDVTNGNFLDVLAGGTANNTTIEGGGSVRVEALTNGPLGLGPILGLLTPGGVANGVTVNSGGSFELQGSNSAASDVTLNGGLFTIDQTASVTGSLTFTGSGPSAVEFFVNDANFKPTITGFSASSALDCQAINFSDATFKTVVSGGNTIATLSGDGVTETFTFAGTPQLKIVGNNNTDRLPEAVIVTTDTTSRFALPFEGAGLVSRASTAPATETNHTAQPAMNFLSHPQVAAGSPAGLGLSDATLAQAATKITAATQSLGSIAHAMTLPQPYELGRSMFGASALQHLAGTATIPALTPHLG